MFGGGCFGGCVGNNKNGSIVDLQWTVFIVTVGGIVVAWLYQRNDAPAHQVVGASVTLIEQLQHEIRRLNATIAYLQRQLRQWQRYAALLRNQIWRLGHDPDEDEPTNGVDNSHNDRFDTPFATAFANAFDVAAIDRLLLTLDKQREAISTADSKIQIVFDVVETASREGWLAELKRAALDANPRNRELRNAAE